MSEVTARDGRAQGEPLPATRSAAEHAPAVPGFALLVLIALGTPAAHAGKCTITPLPDIPVTMRGLRPLVHAQINGTDALFVADSGAFFSNLTPAAVQQFQLRVDHSIHNFDVGGVGGREPAEVARAKTFTIMGVTVPNVPFVVAGSGFGGAVGLLGQNVFRLADVEYDLANGVIRLLRPKDCGKDTLFAYWVGATHQPYSVIDIEFATAREPHTRSVAYLNGTKIRVIFDTGAGHSLLTLGAARRAGITPASEGVTPGGAVSGLGHQVSKTWIARFASFRIGDEDIQHARLRFGDIFLPYADMLIGADFFLSHRIYVASSQKKLYFTYNGGPVFDLTAAPVPAEAADTAAGSGGPAAAEPRTAAGVDSRLDQPTDASAYARRGAASAARLDYADALKDLTRACELAPSESAYFYQRGLVRLQNEQADLAMADFDQAIKLKADDADALLARASLREGRHDSAAMIAADLDAADRALPQQADARLGLGNLYAYAGQPAAAVVQYSKWIDSHPRADRRMAGALNSRCRARALAGKELEQALLDCNAALRIEPNTAAFLDSRGLVYLRLSKYDKAITEYDAALRLNPGIAWALYGRGVAKLRKGRGAEGQADLDSASAIAPRIAEEAAQHGIQP